MASNEFLDRVEIGFLSHCEQVIVTTTRDYFQLSMSGSRIVMKFSRFFQRNQVIDLTVDDQSGLGDGLDSYLAVKLPVIVPDWETGRNNGFNVLSKAIGRPALYYKPLNFIMQR